MKKVIIFDGENDHEIGQEYFFQDELINSLTPNKTVEMYQSTAVFLEVLLDIEHLIEAGVIKNVNDKAVSPAYVTMVKEGLSNLEGMLDDLFGEETAGLIKEKTRQDIDTEFTPDEND